MAEQTVVRRRRPRSPNGQRRSRGVTLRLAPGEWDAVTAAAAAKGLSVGAYVGMLAEDVRRDRPVLSVEAVGELVAARQQVRRIGTNVNQIAAAVNTDGAVPAEASAVLAAAARAIVRLEQAADRVWSA
jgi:Bacterial mobilisation protein (MobC)